MSVFFNLGSLVLGLMAWIVPVVALARWRKAPGRCGFLLASLSACALSLTLQLFEVGNRVHLEDWSALMDTIDAVLMVSVILVVVTVGLNLAAWTARRTRG